MYGYRLCSSNDTTFDILYDYTLNQYIFDNLSIVYVSGPTFFIGIILDITDDDEDLSIAIANMSDKTYKRVHIPSETYIMDELYFMGFEGVDICSTPLLKFIIV